MPTSTAPPYCPPDERVRARKGLTLKKLPVLAAAFVVVLGGIWASYVPYEKSRATADICDLGAGACGDSVLLRKSLDGSRNLDLGIIEFDDQGQLQNRRLADAVLAQARSLASTNRALTIVVFAHGWNHNASAGDANLRSFVEMLEDLDCAEVKFAFYNVNAEPAETSSCDGVSQRATMGIYLGWHGRSWRGPLHVTSFWARKATAERIGERGAAEILYRLSEIRNGGADSANRLVIVGHSFGGSLVYSAAAHAVQSSLERLAVEPQPRFADMLIVINAAFEAQRAEALQARSMEIASVNPLFVAVTATNDTATRVYFPLGRWFSTRFRRYRSDDGHAQAAADRTALGHYEPFQTHSLATCLAADGRAALSCATQPGATLERPTDRAYFNDWVAAAVCWQNGRGEANWRLAFPTANLYSLADGDPLTAPSPFMNIAAHRDLVDDHGGIWQPSLRLFLRDLVAMSYSAPELADERCSTALEQ